MDREIIVKCEDCGSKVSRPAVISSTGHMMGHMMNGTYAWVRCPECSGKMFLDKPMEPEHLRNPWDNCNEKCHTCGYAEECFDATFVNEEPDPRESCKDRERTKKALAFLKATREPASIDWFSYEENIKKILKQSFSLHEAKPLIQTHRAGSKYHNLLAVIQQEGVVLFPDGKKYVCFLCGEDE